MDHTTGLNRPSTTLAPHLWADEAREDRSNAENEQRERLQRVLARLSRRHPSAAPSYGDRAPLPTQQSLYDWAPQDQADDEQGLEDILGELRRQHPGTHSDILEFLGRRQLIRQRESEDDAARTRLRTQQSRNEPSTTAERRNESLRSAAIMQNARTSVRSPSGTERMLRYLRNRERTGQRNEGEREDAEDMTSTPPRSAIPPASSSGSRYESNRLAWQTRQPSFQNGRNQDAASDREARRDNDARARTDAYRRGYLAENPAADRTSPTSPPSPFLEDAVAYLDCLRACSSYEDSLSAAVDHGLALKDFFADNHDDFMTSTCQCPAPPPSSLLQPGAVFEGTQNTASPRDSEDTAYRSLGLGSSSMYANDASRAFDATRPWLSHTPTSPPTYTGRMNDPWSNSYKPFQDRWPVKVIIQAVDYEKMTMAGIMEAYDVPTTTNSVAILASSSFSRTNQPVSTPHSEPSYQHSTVSKRAFPITTYLEGQIIDFSTHSFLTPAPGQSSSFRGEGTTLPRHQAQEITFPPTSAVTDAANWRNLPPFNTMKSDEEVARTLLSRSRMQAIMAEWIFMRWKERCFIHLKSDSCHRHEHVPSNGVLPLGEGDDTDTGHGLTISGFYYVSLRRSDGKIEGLYFDTKTSPYQHLRLESKRSGMHGAWQFK